jgi:catalase
MTTPELEPAEIPLVAEIVAENHRMEPREDGRVVGRAQHRKHHGCVAAVFQVVDDVPMELRHGVFANSGARFDTLIRFSNGRQQNDREPDTHGMAIKLLDVQGKRPDGQE